MNPRFDHVAHEIEARLRDLRRLVAEMAILTDSQDALLAELTDALETADHLAAALRRDLLETVGDAFFAPPEPEAPPAPAPAPPPAPDEDAREPMAPLDDAGKVRLLREMREVAQEMGLPFDGGEELAELEARIASPEAS